jgi:hypothetical protein
MQRGVCVAGTAHMHETTVPVVIVSVFRGDRTVLQVFTAASTLPRPVVSGTAWAPCGRHCPLSSSPSMLSARVDVEGTPLPYRS